MQPIAYAAMLAVIAPLSVMIWLAFTGDRAGCGISGRIWGGVPAPADPALSANEQLAALSQEGCPGVTRPGWTSSWPGRAGPRTGRWPGSLW